MAASIDLDDHIRHKSECAFDQVNGNQRSADWIAGAIRLLFGFEWRRGVLAVCGPKASGASRFLANSSQNPN